MDKDLLIHTALCKTILSLDADRNPTFSEGVEVPCRMVSVKETSLTSLGEQKNDRFSMYIDCALSPDFIPTEDMRVTWNNETFIARSVKPCYALATTPEHYKVSLV